MYIAELDSQAARRLSLHKIAHFFSTKLLHLSSLLVRPTLANYITRAAPRVFEDIFRRVNFVSKRVFPVRRKINCVRV